MNTIELEVGKAKKKVAFGAAGISLFLHLGLLLLVGGVVVVEYAVPRSAMTGELTPVISDDTAPAPEENPESTGEPQSTDAPSEMPASAAESAPADLSVSSIDVISVNNPVSNFQMPSAISGTGGPGTGTLGGGPGPGTGGKGKPGKVSNPFGGSERLGNGSMEGVLYDLKQTKDGKPNGMTQGKYGEIMKEFFSKNWNMRVLNEYYQVKKPLYTGQIYMPLMGASAAPAAFEVEKEVQPAQWVVIYNGVFQSPKTGHYRFAGYADDVMGVRVDGKNVLDGSRASMKTPKGAATSVMKFSDQEFVPEHKVGNGVLAYSDWLRFNAGESHKIEILVGEQPGGQFCAYLFIQEKGVEYKKEASGRPILPIFRTADLESPPTKDVFFEENGPIFEVK